MFVYIKMNEYKYNLNIDKSPYNEYNMKKIYNNYFKIYNILNFNKYLLKDKLELSEPLYGNPIVNPIITPIVNQYKYPFVNPVITPIVNPIVNQYKYPFVNPVITPVVNPVITPIVNPIVTPIVNRFE